ncbi:MAG TPA: ATP synthase subunit I [Candidatus Angelobacter sp.]|nr:ATP synthase subunit I [Candidatus Angelobacter sp.]
MDSAPFGDPVDVQKEEAFYAEVYRRLVAIMAVLGVCGTITAGIWYGWVMAATFLVGSVIAVLNFHWLKRTIEAMGGRLPSRAGAASGVVLRFLLRYILIAVAAYVILKSTTNSLYGFFAGLAIPAGAIVIEAMYETYRALRGL